MNVFNRFILVLLLLGLILLLTLGLLFPAQILTVTGQFLLDWGKYFTQIDQQQQMLRLIISIGIVIMADLIIVLWIYLEIRPKRKRFVQVEQVSGGKATVSLDSIVRQLLYRLDPLPGVVKVTPTVSPKGDKIQARLDVTVTRELAVPQMADCLISTTQKAIKDDLGLVLAGEPQIRIKVIEGVQRRSTALSALPASEQSNTAHPTTQTTAEEQLGSSISPDPKSHNKEGDWA